MMKYNRKFWLGQIGIFQPLVGEKYLYAILLGKVIGLINTLNDQCL